MRGDSIELAYLLSTPLLNLGLSNGPGWLLNSVNHVFSLQNLRGFASHTGWIKCVSSVSSMENQFVTGSYDHSLKLWDLRSSVPLATIKGHTDKVCDWVM